MKRLLISLWQSLSRAFQENEEVISLVKRHPKVFDFLEKRLSRKERYGLWFTLGSLASATFFVFFAGLAQDILAKDPFVEADVRIMNLVAFFRTPSTGEFFLFFTQLGSGAVITILGLSLTFLFWLSGRRRKALFLLGSIAVSQTLYVLFKILVHRMRPDEAFAWVPRGGYSFPSGHTASSILFYGMIGFFLGQMARKKSLKVLTAWLFGFLIFFIGFSRIYLGVHWLSDVLAGWALGGALLVLFISFFNEKERFEPESKQKTLLSRQGIATLGLLMGLGIGGFVYRYNITHPLTIREGALEEGLIIAQENNLEKTVLSEDFPKFSETLTGEKMEPLSFVVVGSEQGLIEAFQAAGWYVADPPHPKDFFRLAGAALFNKNYPTAAVTPAFIAKQPNTLAFEKPTEKKTVRERHHTRYWKTNYEVNGEPVWIATSSFDDGIQFLITHHIQPDVDTEREFIRDELLKTGKVLELGKFQLVKSFLGENQAANPFFTDGKTYLLKLQ